LRSEFIGFADGRFVTSKTKDRRLLTPRANEAVKIFTRRGNDWNEARVLVIIGETIG
jgi:hypothetical protein